MTRAMERAPEVLSLEQLVDYTGFSLPELAEMRKPGGVAAGADNAGLITFCLTAHAHGLDPRRRQCYWIKRAGTYTFQTGIDGFAAIADRSGKFAGIDPVDYRGTLEIDNPKDRSHPLHVPAQAEATVWKLVGTSEQVRPFRAVVHWEEYYPGPGDQGFMWRDKPRRMLGKCATAQALRMAFPEQLGDVDLAEDEMQRGRTLDVSERPAARAAAPKQLEQPARRSYEDIFETDEEARADQQTARAHAVAERAQAAAKTRDETAARIEAEQQRLAELAEVDRQRKEEGLL